jgi:prepilin-type processing-associated H-X9-DG protein
MMNRGAFTLIELLVVMQANYLFFDGHVQLLDWNHTVDPEDMWGAQQNNSRTEPAPSL